MSECGLGGRVFDVFAGALVGGFCFGLGVSIRLQGVNRFAEAERLAAFGRGARGNGAGRLRRGQIPFQAIEFDFEIVADVKSGDTIAELFEGSASVLQLGARREDGLEFGS